MNHILSSSWGPYDDGMRLEGPGTFLTRAFEQGARTGVILSFCSFSFAHNSFTGRNGKGAIYVWAAGNGRGARDNCNYDG